MTSGRLPGDTLSGPNTGDLASSALNADSLAVVVSGDSMPEGRPQSVGLVLSGGGAKGIAHIGVIRALEDNNIPIDYIAGTSMGAIVGGLYAMGYTTDEMMDLILSKDFSYWSTGKIDPTEVYYFSRSEPTPAMFTFPISSAKDKATDSVPASLISPLPMNLAFMELFSAYTARCGGDFNKLFVPFRCVASDVKAGHKVVHSSGSLGDAIRSSMSFPIVFQPIRMNGALLYDGGIYDNFPVEVMTRDFSPEIMIGVDVSTPATGPQTSLMDQVDNLVMQHQSYALDPRLGIKIKIDLHQFSLLDFEAADKIYTIGYNKAMSMMDSIKTRVTARIPDVTRRTARGVFKSTVPYVRFDSVRVTGATAKQNRYITYLFMPGHHADTFGIAHARQSYYRAISPGRLRDLYPQALYDDTTGMFTLDLKASVKNKFNIGVGGYITSSTNSYLYGSVGFKTMSFSSMSAHVGVWLGQSLLGAHATGDIHLRTPIPSSVSFDAVASRRRYYENEHLFYQTNAPCFIIDHEYYGRASLNWAAGSRGKFSLGVGYGHLYDSFYPNNLESSYIDGRDRSYYNLGQALLRFKAGTLNNDQFPTSGAAYNICAMGLLGNYHYDPAASDFVHRDNSRSTKWIQLEIRTQNYFDLQRHWALGFESDILLSTRGLASTYNASIVNAPGYNPTSASHNLFNPAMRANSFIGVGIVPVYKFNSSLTARLMANCFLPLRHIEPTSLQITDSSPGEPVIAPTPYGVRRAEASQPVIAGDIERYGVKYGRWLSNPEFYGELNLSYSFPFATLSGYVNYVTAGARHWNLGLTLGVYLTPPRFLR